jgi:Na+-transporting NADH:ubiquinone oxidoreductase subunit NqrD
VAFESLLLINGLKQLFSFGFGYGVIPWITSSGYQNTFGVMAAIQVAIVLLGLPLWYWGKAIRDKTADLKVIYW